MENVVFKTDIRRLTDALDGRNRTLWNAIRKGENYEWFRNLWNKSANLYEFYELYRKVRKDTGLELRDFTHYDRLWQSYNILDPIFSTALKEWAELLVN